MVIEANAERVIEPRAVRRRCTAQHLLTFVVQVRRNQTRESIAQAEGDEVDGVIDLPVWQPAAGFDSDVGEEVVVAQFVFGCREAKRNADVVWDAEDSTMSWERRRPRRLDGRRPAALRARHFHD